MTVQSGPADNQPASPPPGHWLPEDEIDLREYILVLVSWWREILLVAVLAALLGAAAVVALRVMQAPVYEASAQVAIARTTSNIIFDERFQTDLSQMGEEQVRVGSSGRRAALVGLVHNGAVAEAVAAELGDRLGEEEGRPAALLERVTAELVRPEGGNTDADLIRISASADDPEEAAAIANAWARAYVQRTNDLYGQVPDDLISAVQTELADAQTAYEEAQNALESFIAGNEIDRLERLIGEKEEIITALQTGRQTAVRTIVDEELAARSEVISAYINALSQNRLLAFEKEQEAKRELLSAYIDAEVENHLLAFQKDRQARVQLYEHMADAELQAVTAVLDEQTRARVDGLSRAYAERGRLQTLLADAEALQQQVEIGGEAAVQTNALALVLLKTQIFAAVETGSTSTQEVTVVETVDETADRNPTQTARRPSGATAEQSTRTVDQEITRQQNTITSRPPGRTLPGNLQLNLDTVPGSALSPELVQEDLDALVQVLEGRIDSLDASIETQSQNLLDGSGYQHLDGLDANRLASAGSPEAEEGLQQAILSRYQDLYGTGQLAQAAQPAAGESELFANIEALYPALFQTDELSRLSQEIATGNPLAVLGEERAKQLLQLEGLEDVPDYSASAEPLIQAIDNLESDIQDLQAQRESETARRQRLTRERDLALSTLDTLKNKSAELQIASTGGNSEVRFASAAVAPLRPTVGPGLLTTTALAGIVGLMLAVFLVFILNMMDVAPPLQRKQAA